MLSVMVSAVLLAGLVLGPIAWRLWRDRREERALAVRAEVAAAMRGALDGDSLVSVQVEPPRAFRSGRVILSVPGGWEWLIREAWTRTVPHVPCDYELVVRAGERSAPPAPAPRDVLRRAA